MLRKNLRYSVLSVVATALLFGDVGISKVSASGMNTKIDSETLKHIDDINLLKEPVTFGKNKKDAKLNAVEKHKKAMGIIEDYYLSNSLIISNDIDDKEYQVLVKSLGGTPTVFEEKDRKFVIDFVKFIDLYENYDKNSRIKEIKNKKNKNVITDEEVSEILSLEPISSEDSRTLNTQDPVISIATVFSNGYNNIAARDYAYRWTSNSEKLRNNTQYGYYNRVHNGVWDDCTNFVSQALRAGGFAFRGGSLTNGYSMDTSWFYNESKPSWTWGGAQNFYKHWKVRAGVTTSASALYVGDVVNADFTGDGDMEHTAIITYSSSTTASGKKLTQHSEDKEELTSVQTWYDWGYKVYGYEMDKASN